MRRRTKPLAAHFSLQNHPKGKYPIARIEPQCYILAVTPVTVSTLRRVTPPTFWRRFLSQPFQPRSLNQNPQRMFVLAVGQLSDVLSSKGNAAVIELRAKDNSLVRSVSRHEVELLLAQKNTMVEGLANKKGFRYVRLTVETRQASRVLLRFVTRPNIPRAEDSKTFTSRTCPGGGIIYDHQHNDAYALDAAGRQFVPCKLQAAG